MDINSLLIPEYWVVLVALSKDLLLLFYFLREFSSLLSLDWNKLSFTHDKQTSCYSVMKKCTLFSYAKNMRIKLELGEGRNQTLLGSSEGRILFTVLILLYNGPARSQTCYQTFTEDDVWWPDSIWSHRNPWVFFKYRTKRIF